MIITRDDIRKAASCPDCGAVAGEQCAFTGKGAEKKMRIGGNHHNRMIKAQVMINSAARDEAAYQTQAGPADDDFDMVDDGDDFD